MQRWMYIVVVGVLAFGVYSFVSLVGWRTRWLTSKTARRADDMYDQYAAPERKRRRRSLAPAPLSSHIDGP
ncbi:MAG TPA: hypothetical protein VF070_09435 [Streptosporangiaceae bacterium]